jgi:hypothetical protein
VSRRLRWLALAAVLAVVVGFVAWAWIDVTDPFCWHGYVAEDGMCAEE